MSLHFILACLILGGIGAGVLVVSLFGLLGTYGHGRVAFEIFVVTFWLGLIAFILAVAVQVGAWAHIS